MEKKILIIVENLPVPFDTRVWQEAITLVSNGYTVSVICPKGKGYTKEEEVLEGVNIFRHDLPSEGNGLIGYVREYGSALWSEYKLAKKIYKEIGFHVIQGCNPPDNIFLIAKKFKKYGVKYVFDHHDICPELFYAKFKKYGLLYKSQLWLERQTYKHCDAAFVTNESYKKIAIERGKMDPKNIFVLRSGPKLDRLKIQPPKDEIKKGKKYMIGYLGVIGQQEGIEYLLKAVKYLRDIKGRNDIFCGIVGGGPHLENLKRMTIEMNLSDIVEFTGRVSDEILLDYLNTADVCVNPDEYNEMNDKSTMNKILEYMALGKPIVQFDLAEGRYSAKEASLYAKNNDPVDMANKIELLLNNKEMRSEMGAFGRKRVMEELSWDKTSKALINGYEYIFDNILGGNYEGYTFDNVF
ncbi:MULTISPECIES: glycosyltransferase family 4 protein [unclassified Clostridium]|uniref:glycosyltransferase family 4 protein n=1 Tax=unclassified Clostridium TaxID=2614128 RepID=UPI0002973E54|nr:MULTISPECIES: glycosyltransferase family 4 protein [unclassified Clostridium]EKQ56946.1 MAG: glycosyltransferase [Clostridium sp. Maddingley MBC34-26]